MATSVTDNGTTGDTYGIKEGSRMLVRASNGDIYCAVHNFTQQEIEVYKSTGGAFSIQDSANSPALRDATHDNYAPAACMDGDDVIHINWWESRPNASPYPSAVGLEYVTFDTSTDTFGTRSNAYAGNSGINFPTYPSVSNAISDSYLHVHYADILVGRGTTTDHTYYINMTLSSSTWNTRRTIGADRFWPDVSISNVSNLPMLSSVEDQGGIFIPDVDVYLGNTEAATSFTFKNGVASTNVVSYNICQIVEDAVGNQWVGFPELSSGDVGVVEHKAGDAWGTWQAQVEASANGCDNVSITTRSYGKCIADKYLAYIGSDGPSKPGILNDHNVFQDDSWNAVVNPDANASQHIRAKYSARFNHGGSARFEWVYERGSDVYYDGETMNQFVRGVV